jgi:AcrR family transcriptional regulator
VAKPAARARKRQEKPSKERVRFRWSEANLDRDVQFKLRREALLRTAARAFKELGYHGTSVEELARWLNVTKPTLYYYIKDKDEILFECQRLAFEYIKDALDEAQSKDLNGLEKLFRFLPRFSGLMTSDFGACLIRTGLHPLKQESREVLEKLARQLDVTMRAMIEEGITDGSIRPCNAKLTSFAIFGGYQGIARWFKEGGAFGLEEISEAFASIYLYGLAPRQKGETG